MKTKLPDKLSELLYIALEDLEKVEADPRYLINMGDWHVTNGKCSVCAAGSVMAKRLGDTNKTILETYAHHIPSDEARADEAMENALR